MEKAIRTLEVMTVLAKTIPVLGTPVEGALEVLGKMLRHAQDVKSNKEKTKELAQQATEWFHEVVNALEAVKDKPEDFSRLEEQLVGILKVLEDIEESIRRWTGQSYLQRTLNKSSTLEDIAKLQTRLEKARRLFMFASQSRLEQRQIQISKSVDAVLSAAEKDELLSLQPVTSARYNAKDATVKACLKDTRIELLQRLLDWATEPTTNFTIYWLAGLAGTGKSSIAMSFCKEIAQKDDVLIATFFASRKAAERRDTYRAIHTIVCELARNSSIREHVLKGIRSDIDIRQMPMREQIQRLLITPLTAAQANNTSFPVIIVIDALDECDKIDGIKGGTLIRDMAQGLRDLPVKLMVTSRLEEPLQRMFNSLPNKVNYLLHELDSDEVAADVNNVLVAGFTDIIAKHSIRTIPWPNPADLVELVARTGHLFIYATTLLKYVGDQRYNPETRLQRILANAKPEHTERRTPYADVDSLYLDILVAASQNAEDEFDEGLCQRLRTMLGVLILLHEPATTTTLAALLGKPELEREIESDVWALTAVLLIGKDDNIRIFHESFRDFLLDPNRCTSPQFIIDAEQQQRDLALQCLTILNGTLRQDICDIRDPSVSNSQVTNPILSVRLYEATTELTRYASRFWLAHLSRCSVPSPAIIAALLIFTGEHLLHWLELLSILDDLSHAARNLPVLIQWCLDHSGTFSELIDASQALSDLLQTLTAYRPALTTHALHIYHSALTTMPESPLLREASSIPTLPTLITQRSSEWPPLRLSVVMMGHEDAVQSAIFSPDGTHVVSASKDETVRVWDALTGHQIAEYRDQTTGSINCVDLLPDGTEIVLGADDGTLRLWSYHNGAESAKLAGHTAPVNTVSVSPDGTSIASGSDDRSVRIWNTRSRSQAAVLDEHEKRVYSVVFSLGSDVVTSESEDGYLRRWASDDRYPEHRYRWDKAGRNKSTSAAFHAGAHGAFPPQNPREFGLNNEGSGLWKSHTVSLDGHSNSSHSVAFSPDFTQVACGSGIDGTVRLWDARTGQHMVTMDGHTDGILSVAFSHDGRRIVSASRDQTVRIWDTELGRQKSSNEGQAPDAKVLCTTFSSDGLLVATGSSDNNARLWDAVTGLQQSILKGHDSAVYRAWFSQDNSILLTSTWFGTLIAWDVFSGKQLAVIERNCPEALSAVALSPDSFMIVTGSNGGGIQTWNAVTGQHIVSSQDPNDQHYTVKSVAFSLDNARIVAGGSNGTLRVYDASTGEQLVLLAPGQSASSTVVATAFSPDGTQIISGEVIFGQAGGTVILWDAASGDRLHEWYCELDQLRSVTFSSDGTRIIAQSNENRLCTWVLADGEDAHPSPIASVGWHHSSGWISRYTITGETLPICWIPAELRGDPGWNPFCVHSNTIAIGGTNGRLTIINVS